MISNVDDYKVVATWYLAYPTGAQGGHRSDWALCIPEDKETLP